MSELLVTVWVLLLLLGSGRAGEVPAQPALRVETGMHTAVINRIGTDAQGRYLATGSDDKTVRIWDLQTGALLRTLRPPIGPGNEGKIYAVALSPDGTLVAAAGWIGGKDQSDSIYLFERASGRMVRRITGLPQVVQHLTLSRDGTRLAASLGGDNGIRVFSLATGAELGRDAGYGDGSYGADFDRDGRLIASAMDGFLRLYDRSLKLRAKVPAPGGKGPFAVRFSPDGSQVAVGYGDSPRVDVLSGRDLSLLFQPDVSGIDNGTLARVAWSADGTRLCAGGKWSTSGQRPVRCWSGAGRGPFQDTPAAGDTIMDLAALPRGGMAFGAQGPAWGVIGDGGQRVRWQPGNIADYRNNLSGFLTDLRGGQVRFAYRDHGQGPALFSVASRTLGPDPGPGQGLKPPRTSAPGLDIAGWRNTYEVRLNGKPLALRLHETSRRLAIAPDSNSFLLGTEWWLRSFDRGGTERWEAPVPGEAWAVNLSGDGRLALAAFGDGTIRWYRTQDGKELLALFPHGDGKRWVAWTPTGYYDASPGGEDLIGWHVNRGPDQAADFFPASRFRDRFYRPDVIERVLFSDQDDQALALSLAPKAPPPGLVVLRLPPVVTILLPAEGAAVSSSQVLLKVALRSPSGEAITGVRVLLDGRVILNQTDAGAAAKRPAGPAEEVRTLALPMPPRDAAVAVIAETAAASGAEAVVHLHWAGGTPQSAPAFEIKPRLYLLSVGVSGYRRQDLRLNYPAQDATDLAAAFTGPAGKLYRSVEAKVLTNERATKDGILDGLEWLRRQTTANDVAVLFLAGHGLNDPSTGQYYYLPYDADPERILATMLPGAEVRSTLSSLAGKVVVFLDTCHAGNLLPDRMLRGGSDLTRYVNELASAESGVVVFTAATGRQASQEAREWNNGAFTKAIVEGLRGKADYQKTGRITLNMLDLYISERVKELTRGTQTPATAKPSTVPDFPLVIVPY